MKEHSSIAAALAVGNWTGMGRIALWLKVSLPALGGVGIICSSFIDSSFLPLPLVTDLLVVELSSLHPLRMPLYAALAAIGSLGGCIIIYCLARKGGEAFYLRHQGRSPEKIRRFAEEHPLACVVLPAIAPFPVPFKPFVIAQGVFQVPFVTFVFGTLAGRALRFLIEGYLGVRYGEAAKDFVLHQKWHSLVAVSALVVIFLLVRRLPFFRSAKTQEG